MAAPIAYQTAGGERRATVGGRDGRWDVGQGNLGGIRPRTAHARVGVHASGAEGPHGARRRPEAARERALDPRGDRVAPPPSRLRLRIEALEGLRKTPVSFPPDRPQQVLRSVRVRGLDFLDGPIEVAEDPADLFLQETKARGPEGTNGFAGRLTKFLGAETIRGLQVRFDPGLRKRHQP